MGRFTDSKILFWLSQANVSVRKQVKLLQKYKNAQGVMRAFKENGKEVSDFIGADNYSRLIRFCDVSYIDGLLDKLYDDGISVVSALNPLYPSDLLQSEVCAPLIMYYKGNLEALNKVNVAVVGSRRCTSYGRECAEIISTQLAENGITVVSGLAMGIDTYAHEAAIKAGGITVAVLGSGHNRITPVGNDKLISRIVDNGGIVISEYKPDVAATKYSFPERNRLISGLSKGVVVVEAAQKSGALITAEYAAEQGRDVFAVPGNITSTRSKGCNYLLYNGATFIRDGLDVVTHLGVVPTKKAEQEKIIVDKAQKKLYSFLSDGDKTFDELVDISGMDIAELSVKLLDMEMEGLIVRNGANVFSLKNA